MDYISQLQNSSILRFLDKYFEKWIQLSSKVYILHLWHIIFHCMLAHFLQKSIFVCHNKWQYVLQHPQLSNSYLISAVLNDSCYLTSCKSALFEVAFQLGIRFWVLKAIVEYSKGRGNGGLQTHTHEETRNPTIFNIIRWVDGTVV